MLEEFLLSDQEGLSAADLLAIEQTANDAIQFGSHADNVSEADAEMERLGGGLSRCWRNWRGSRRLSWKTTNA